MRSPHSGNSLLFSTRVSPDRPFPLELEEIPQSAAFFLMRKWRRLVSERKKRTLRDTHRVIHTLLRLIRDRATALLQLPLLLETYLLRRKRSHGGAISLVPRSHLPLPLLLPLSALLLRIIPKPLQWQEMVTRVAVIEMSHRSLKRRRSKRIRQWTAPIKSGSWERSGV
jgi:hypothetical protein